MHAMYFHRISYFVLELVITLRRLSIAHGVFREGGGGGGCQKGCNNPGSIVLSGKCPRDLVWKISESIG